MAKKPISYLQTDSRWANCDYSAEGEKTTIGKSGCGPTSMAMVLATYCDKSVTPKTECAWALKNGYKAPHQGTYYGYFVPAAERYGLKCTRVNQSSIYGNSSSSCHTLAAKALQQGNLVIACMGKGNWTSSGHYILCYDINTSKNIIYINDPNSTKKARTEGNYNTFKQQVKFYWIIEVPSTKEKEEDDMSKSEVQEIVKEMLGIKNEVPAWAHSEIEEAKGLGLTDGSNLTQLVPAYRAIIWALRAYKMANTGPVG